MALKAKEWSGACRVLVYGPGRRWNVQRAVAWGRMSEIVGNYGRSRGKYAYGVSTPSPSLPLPICVFPRPRSSLCWPLPQTLPALAQRPSLYPDLWAEIMAAGRHSRQSPLAFVLFPCLWLCELPSDFQRQHCLKIGIRTGHGTPVVHARGIFAGAIRFIFFQMVNQAAL